MRFGEDLRALKPSIVLIQTGVREGSVEASEIASVSAKKNFGSLCKRAGACRALEERRGRNLTGEKAPSACWTGREKTTQDPKISPSAGRRGDALSFVDKGAPEKKRKKS